MKMKNIKIAVLAFIMMMPALAGAVTQKEMEEARTISAKAYLRYANDGSGYLDDLNPKTMEELEAGLKPKEKENIKAFKAIPVPTDYASWDKEKLVEYWTSVFQNKGLLEKGRGGRIRARSQINKMNIGAPEAPVSAAAAPAVEQPNNPSNPTEEPAALAAAEMKTDSIEVVQDENALRGETGEAKAYNYTWVYIMALCILVAIVVALVVYAANVMKKNGASANPGNSALDRDADERIEHLEGIVADRDAEIAMMKKKAETANRQLMELKSKNEQLAAELSALKNVRSVSHDSPKVATGEQRSSAKVPLRSIFLGRANAKGIFVRADRTLNVGNSVFLLETADGYTGSFRVADSPAAWELGLSNPREYLETACSGKDLGDTSGYSRIVTETAGTAVFEGGRWSVVRKARIRYEA